MLVQKKIVYFLWQKVTKIKINVARLENYHKKKVRANEMNFVRFLACAKERQ